MTDPSTVQITSAATLVHFRSPTVILMKECAVDKSVDLGSNSTIMKTCPCNVEIFSVVNTDKFHKKSFDIFNIFAQNIDCGYMSLRRF